jgi:protein-tyrosine phosphatase
VSVDRIPTPVGALWLAALRDVAPDPEAAMRSVGADVVVCLNQRRELEQRSPGYLAWLERAGDRAVWFPVANFGAESAVSTLPVLEVVVDRLRAGGSALMHCAYGQGRAGTMAVCVLMMLGVPSDEAIRTVAEHRAHAGPGQGAQWALVDDVARAVGPPSR